MRSGARLSVLNIPTAEVFEPLLGPSRRCKGRAWRAGSGKSHFFAGLMIEDSLAEKGFFGLVSARCKRPSKIPPRGCSNLSDFRLGEPDGFKIYEDRIKTPGDGVVIFQGMQDHTAE